MATIQISAHAAEFTKSELGFTCMRYKPLDAPLYRDNLEASQVQVILDVMRRLHDRLANEQPSRSFFVTARVVTGRRPNGFQRIPRFDYDAGPLVAAVDNAVDELVAAGKIDPDNARRAA